ncbi:MAG: O-antigen ligase family protein [Sedimentisphaerales bacterium]|nr:O-antigen ligase family protein [Sedimentisphaerales bacterium]
MNRPSQKSDPQPPARSDCSGRTGRLETVLLLLAGLLITARSTLFESFPRRVLIQNPSQQIDIGNAEVVCMALMSLLILSGLIFWLVIRARRSPWRWRNTGLLGPLLLLLVGSVISAAYASNRHVALITAATLLGQIVLVLLLVQWLDTAWKQRLLLCILGAAGVVMGYRCWELYSYELPATEANFLQDPNAALASQGIDPGTYAARQYIARVTSRDVRGYFGTSNTAASFFLLSIAATLVLLLERPGGNRPNPDRYFLMAGLLLLLLQGIGLALTQSKGGIAAGVLALAVFGGLWMRRDAVCRQRRRVLTIAIILLAAAVLAVIGHGLHHHRLPTNSLWMRWQYWQTSAKMIADHGVTGVGPGNFGQYYPRYLDPAAPEVVKDPHCLVLTVWCEWGLFGILAFFWALAAVVRQVTKAPPETPVGPEPDTTSKPAAGKGPSAVDLNPVGRIWPWGLALAAGLCILRIGASDLSGVSEPANRISIYVVSFMIPSAIWLVAFLILAALARLGSPWPADTPAERRVGLWLLGFGLLAFLLHNSIDFGFFQPGVGTFFCAVLALLLARRHGSNPRVTDLRVGPAAWMAIIVAGLAVLAGWLILMPRLYRSQKLLESAPRIVSRAHWYLRQNRLPAREILSILNQARDQATGQLAAAGRLNPLDPDPAYLRAQTLIWQAKNTGRIETHNWQAILAALEESQRRDPADYHYYRQLGEICLQAAVLTQSEQQSYAARALDFADQALQRYPTNGSLLLFRAQILELFGPLLNRPAWRAEALEDLQRLLRYERDYRRQQQEMYPDEQHIPDRLDPILQQAARRLLDQLQNESAPSP